MEAYYDENVHLSLSEIITKKLFPMSMTKLRRLIKEGERKKSGKKVYDYIIGVNYGTKKMPRWYVTELEISNWKSRKARSSN